ncbi:MAG: AGE family epimerase/isomerase [Oscillospiraceae bacterium]|nr:AGE family epimerase/isomerase [Oscillospiraceae bacterium]MBQ7119014.1 AGE family epimerase/isomerase [Oscillospiraceae bacterium]
MNYRKYLTEDILAFWIKNATDQACGGIMTQVDQNGHIYCEDKNVWFLGRSMWTYAVAYNTLEKRQEYFDMCETLYRFFDKCELPNGKLPHIVTRDGTAKKINEKLFHSEMHAVMGLAQYYRICKREEVWEKANKYFDVVARWYKDNRSRKETAEGTIKCFGPNLLLLSMAQFIRNVGRDTEKYDELAGLAIDEMMHGGFVSDENETVFENVSENGKMISGDNGTVSYPGHVYEAAWFAMCEGEVKNDDELRNFGRKLCDYAMPKDFPQRHKLIPIARDVRKVSLSEADKSYVWWPQCEAIITYRLAYNIFGDKKYSEFADYLEKNAFNAFADFRCGEWYSEVSQDGLVIDSNKGSLIKGPFHLPRMLLALISLEETGNIQKYMK